MSVEITAKGTDLKVDKGSEIVYYPTDDITQRIVGDTIELYLNRISRTPVESFKASEFTNPTGTAEQISDAISLLSKGAGEGAHGFFDYNDLATATTPISVTGGAGFVYLTNDELGAFTNKNFPPPNVSDIWNATTQEFDFSALPLGSKVDIRLDLTVTTASPNTQVDSALQLGIGNAPYIVQWEDIFEKSAGAHRLVNSNFIYIGDTNTQNFPAKFEIEADGDIDVKVNGWACYITLY